MDISAEQQASHNCIHITIASMLRRQQVDEELLFSQAGLHYLDRKQEEQPCVIDPYYYNFTDCIHRYFDKEVRFETHEDSRKYMDALTKLLQKGYSVAVFADAYELEYCNAQNRMHALHCFEVVSCNGPLYEINDPYYHYTGIKDHSQMVRIFENSLSFLSKIFKLCYLEQAGNLQVKPHNFQYTIHCNYQIMSGIRVPDCNLKNGIIGLNAMEAISAEMMTALREEENVKTSVITHLFNCFKEVSNSRLNFHIYLNKFSQKELAQCYAETHQSWMALANILMKASMMRDETQMEQRLLHRIDLIRKQEIHTMNQMEGILSRL